MRRRSGQWEARHEGGGRFRVRRRSRWVGGPVLVGLVVLVGGGVASGLWGRFTTWLWDTAHLTGGTVLGAAAIVTVLTLVWRAGR